MDKASTGGRTSPHCRKNYLRIKRITDVVLSVLGLCLNVPFLAIVALLVKLDSSGPLIYQQQRLGRNGRVFKIIKFRTMCEHAEQGVSEWASKSDPRVTRVGRFLRRLRLDEVPQLWNVLKGDMSLVGPRPERPDLTRQFNAQVPGFLERLQVEQGITGWAQVNGGYELTPQEKLAYDLEYIQRQSICFDLWILAKTIIVVITGRGAR